ncbi:MAG: PTS sugar transporter subunit IIA [Elusimicrobia bacterium]|nr:PTS sugar transporter subunit IIA [Elusimicrobiota bacterium]
MIGIIVVTHGKFGEEMISSAESIAGRAENIRNIHLPSEESPEVLKKRFEAVISEMDKGDGVLVLTDMLGGTPCNICLPYTRTHRIEVVSGINLYMLLTAMIHREKMCLDELTNKVVEAGQKNIVNLRRIVCH